MVSNHATKACEAGLAQRQALGHCCVLLAVFEENTVEVFKPQKWEVNESKLMIEGTEKAGRLHDHEPCNDIGILIGCMACAAGTASPNNNLKTQAPRTFM
jgi:hypothetical protein